MTKKILHCSSFLLLLGLLAAYTQPQANADNQHQQPAINAHTAATDNTHNAVRVLSTNTANQPFDMAAKLQWNPHHKRWDKVLVLYNGAQRPPEHHPAWSYLKTLDIPQRGPKKAGENLAYRSFHLNAYCTGETALSKGKPLYISFDQNRLGAYQEKDYFRDWNCPKWQMGLANTQIVGGNQARIPTGKALRVNFMKGLSGCDTDKSCINWKPKMGAALDSLYYSYWVYFPPNFDFVMGGKLPGIGNDDASAGGGKPTGRDGWSVRAMWNRDGQMGQYVYHMDQPKHFGEFMPWAIEPMEKGRWYQIKTFVRLNTPGQPNGMIRTWVNGQTVLNRQDIRFRLQPGLKIERFLFSVFYGGSGPQWAPGRNTVLYLDDFIISARPL